MAALRSSWLFLILCAGAASQAADPVRFSHDIAPILIRKCISCHGPDKAKGSYRVDSYQWLLRIGDGQRSPIQGGHPTQSELFLRVTTVNENDRMPQKDDPLPAAEVALIRRWIEQGGKFDGTDPSATLHTLAPPEPAPAAPDVYSRSIPILSLAFNRSGTRLAVGGYREVILRDPTNGTLLARWGGLPERIHSLAFSPDGSRLAVGGGAPGQHGEVLLLETDDGAVVQRLSRTRDTVLAVCFDLEGRSLATAGADHSIRVYDLPEGQPRLLIQQHADWVLALAIDPQGKRLASGSRDGTARVYSLDMGELETTYHDHRASVWAVAFDPKGETVLSAGADKVHLWSIPEGKKTGELKGWSGAVYQLVAAGDAIFVAGPVARQYSIGERKMLRDFSGQTDTLYALAYHPETRFVAAGAHDGQVHVWNAEDGAVVAVFPGWPGE